MKLASTSYPRSNVNMPKRHSSELDFDSHVRSIKSLRISEGETDECERSESNVIEERNKFDVISRLIDLELGNIVEKILLHLSEADVAKAVTANPKYAQVVTSKQCAEQFFSRHNGGDSLNSVRDLYERSERLCKNDERDVRAIFLQACTHSWVLDKFSSDWGHYSRIPCLTIRSNFYWQLKHVCVSDKYIVKIYLLVDKRRVAQCKDEILVDSAVIRVYNRWTLRLVNAISLPGMEIPRIDFIGDSAFIHLRSGRNALVVWNQLTGEMRTLWSSSQRMIVHTFSVSKLIVLLKSDGCRAVASVYKFDNDETCRSPELIVDNELVFKFNVKTGVDEIVLREIQSGESFNLFGIVGFSKDQTQRTFQLRSKEDFSLVRTLDSTNKDWDLSFWRKNAFLLSDCFFFSDSSNGEWLQVLSLSNGKVREVYAFKKPKGFFSTESINSDICQVKNCLILRNARRRGVAIWKLPANFIETCSRHLAAGTVGITLKCDQLVDENGRHLCYLAADRYGVTEIYNIELDNPRMLRVMRFNSVVLDGVENVILPK